MADTVPTTLPTESAVIVAVPAAETAVAEHRRRLDRAASWGVPAHVTVLYPFVPPDRIDGAVLDRLAVAVATVPAFECRFARTGWFGEDVVYLAPEPAGAFRALTAAVWAAFPPYPPYEGAFADVVPHLTLGERAVGGSVEALRAAEADVVGRLPVDARVGHVTLIAGTHAPDSWRTVRELPLG